jgi:ubiquinone/menaquinone biosynthesis C-methylase UbiE
MFINTIPGTTSRLIIVDHEETYGRHVLERALRVMKPSLCVDLGCGNGDDLMLVKKRNPDSRCIGVDIGSWNKEKLVAIQLL